jgi:exonuclease SbcC
MSHKETAIEPGEGIAALVGPNNCGKSAVLVGLEAVCHRLQGDFMVAHGAKEASVTVETDDGHVIAWSRKGKKVRFTIDGEDFDRPRDPVVLKRVSEVLRLPKVGSSETELHFGKQKEPVFDAIAKPLSGCVIRPHMRHD